MKSEVYSWRLSRDLKDDLEEAGAAAARSVSRLLERIAREWLQDATLRRRRTTRPSRHRLRAVAMQFAGTHPGRRSRSRVGGVEAGTRAACAQV